MKGMMRIHTYPTIVLLVFVFTTFDRRRGTRRGPWQSVQGAFVDPRIW